VIAVPARGQILVDARGGRRFGIYSQRRFGSVRVTGLFGTTLRNFGVDQSYVQRVASPRGVIARRPRAFGRGVVYVPSVRPVHRFVVVRVTIESHPADTQEVPCDRAEQKLMQAGIPD